MCVSGVDNTGGAVSPVVILSSADSISRTSTLDPASIIYRSREAAQPSVTVVVKSTRRKNFTAAKGVAAFATAGLGRCDEARSVILSLV